MAFPLSVLDHTTISRFKIRCMPFIKTIFAGRMAILVERGGIKLSGDLYIDGSTVCSRASRRKIKWRGNYERFSASADDDMQEAVDGLLDQVENGDSCGKNGRQGHAAKCTPEEATPHGKWDRGTDSEGRVQENSRKINVIRDACDRKEAHGKVVEQCNGRCEVAPTDPDCGIMHAKEDGHDGNATPNYNVQIATQNQYVTNYDAYDSAEDKVNRDGFCKCMHRRKRRKAQVRGRGCRLWMWGSTCGLEKLQIGAVVKYPNYDAESTRRVGFKKLGESAGLLGGQIIRYSEADLLWPGIFGFQEVYF